MNITITLSDRQAAGLTRTVADFNAKQAEADKLTPEQFALVEFGHIAKKWEASAPDAIPMAEWLQRWTDLEKRAALLMAAQNAQLLDWWVDLLNTVNFRYDDPRAQAGVPELCQSLEAAGVIDPGQAATRAAAILAY